MTTVAYALGKPRAAGSRGGDCKAHDLSEARDVRGPHHFADTTHCQISNGMLRLTVGASGSAPSLLIEAWRGRVNVEDYADDIASDIAPGSISTPEWISVGTLTIDANGGPAVLTGVKLPARGISADEVTIRLVAPLIADAFITLPRGQRAVSIQHGSTRPPTLDINRRIRLTVPTYTPVGTGFAGRVEEVLPKIESFPRMISSFDAVTVDAGQFALVATSVISARFGFGVGTWGEKDTPSWTHRQIGDASRPAIVLTEDEA